MMMSLQQELAPHLVDLETVIARYSQADPLDQAAIELKREHSFRVLANAALIADAEGYPGPVRECSLLAALFHDTGRFPQYDRYKTFHDPISENHARLGVLTLKQAGLPRHVAPGVRRTVLAAVMVHNRKYLPAGLGPELVKVAQCVRDADKLDILQVMLDHFTGKDSNLPAVRLNVQDDPDAYSQVLYDQAYSGATGEYSAMRWVNDFKLLLLTWVYGFHTRSALGELQARNLMGSIADTLPKIPPMSALRHKVLEDLEKLAGGGAPRGC